MPTILVIEDEAPLRELFRAFLETSNYRVTLASNGREGLSAYLREPTDLVLCDMFMPDLDGLGTMRALHRLDAGVKIVAMSGGGVRVKSDFLTVASALGAVALLSKPFGRAELLDTIARVLDPMTEEVPGAPAGVEPGARP